MEPQPAPIVVMGVSGSGKSTVGAALAARLRVPFLDGDDLHPPGNIAKMTSGRPLNDADRHPWLERIGEWLVAHHGGGVVACSALRRDYRGLLRARCPPLQILHLCGPPELITRRLRDRPAHFMPAALLLSQFEALEPLADNESGIAVDVDHGVDAIVDEMCAFLSRGR